MRIMIYSLSCNHPLKSTQLQWRDGTPQKLHQLLPFVPSCWNLMGVKTEIQGQSPSPQPGMLFVKTHPFFKSTTWKQNGEAGKKKNLRPFEVFVAQFGKK